MKMATAVIYIYIYILKLYGLEVEAGFCLCSVKHLSMIQVMLINLSIGGMETTQPPGKEASL